MRKSIPFNIDRYSTSKEYRTRDGRKVTILDIDKNRRDSRKAIVGLVQAVCGDRDVFTWDINGRFDCSKDSVADICEIVTRGYIIVETHPDREGSVPSSPETTRGIYNSFEAAYEAKESLEGLISTMVPQPNNQYQIVEIEYIP